LDLPDGQDYLTEQDLQLVVAGVEERLTKRMRDLQTEMLRAFHNRARPSEIKLRSHGATARRWQDSKSESPCSKNASTTPTADTKVWLRAFTTGLWKIENQ
jgi:hypothetical protein